MLGVKWDKKKDKLNIEIRAGEMDFKVGGRGGMEHVLSATMVCRQEKFSNSRRARMANSFLIVSALKPFLFLPLPPFFLFATQKNEGAMAPPVSPALEIPLPIQKITKRNILRKIDSIYDVLGFKFCSKRCFSENL